LALSARSALADGSRALELGHEGLELYDRGDAKAALDRFERAEAEAHSPVFLLYAALCKRRLGAFLAARALFAQVTRETLPADAPAPWKKAQSDASTALSDLDAKTPKVVVVVRSARPDDRARIDGADVALGIATPLDPGPHRAVLLRGGEPLTELGFTAIEGAAPATVELDGAPHSVPTASASAPPPMASSASRAAPTPPRGSLVPGGVVLALGLGSGVVGAVFGVIAKSTESDIKANCSVDLRCLASDASRKDRAQAFATISTATFIGGGVLAAAGVALLITRPFGAAGPSVAFAPTSLQLRGSF
jgi:hypothetical protein